MNTLKNILLKLRLVLLAVVMVGIYGCGGGGVAQLPLAAHPA